MYTPLRLTLTGACLIVPGVLVAALAPFDRFDGIVRMAFIVALVCSVIVRLFVAVRSHEGAHDELVSRLHLDDLTKLPTRARFVSEVEDVLEATWRSEFQPTIIQLNLDRFKNINDSLGHYEANEVLVIVADRLNGAATAYGGVVARSGGDDFVIIDATTTSADDAMERLEAVREALAAPFRVGEGSVFVSASFGVAVAPRNRTHQRRGVHAASRHRHPRGQGVPAAASVAVFDDSMQSHLAHRMDVEHALHGAIGRQEMHLYHQPIVDIRHRRRRAVSSRSCVGSATASIVPPGDFITIAEETGIICELGAWALHEALGELRGWIDDGVVDPATTISVNVSPRQIADPDFAAVVRDALDATGMPAQSAVARDDRVDDARGTGAGRAHAPRDPRHGRRGSPSTTSAPATRRCRCCSSSRSNASRSIGRSSTASPSRATTGHSSGPSSPWRSRWRSISSPRASRRSTSLQVLSELACDKAQGYLISRPGARRRDAIDDGRAR